MIEPVILDSSSGLSQLLGFGILYLLLNGKGIKIGDIFFSLIDVEYKRGNVEDGDEEK